MTCRARTARILRGRQDCRRPVRLALAKVFAARLPKEEKYRALFEDLARKIAEAPSFRATDQNLTLRLGGSA